MADGFFSRWSQRKREVETGKPVEAEPAPPPVTPIQAAPLDASVPSLANVDLPQEVPPPLTVQDAQALTPQSDFKPFMAGSVTPDVRNAAMKQLFADPHFNVMDGLDIYIDDYSKSDPIPPAMLRQMTSAKFLKLFEDESDEDDEKKKDGAASPRESANNPTGETVAQSSYESPDIAALEPSGPPNISQSAPPVAGASQEDHAHTDLRLQPDDAAPAPGAGRGAQ
jgi:hypothetical protein